MSDRTRHVLEIIFLVAVNGPLSVLGVGLGLINIIIFIKQGFNDSINISLCGLAISDMGSVIAQVLTGVCFNPLLEYLNVDFVSAHVVYGLSGWIHGLCVRITSLITAFITFERCICVALPIKVKVIITPRRTFLIVFAIFVVMFVGVIPAFCSVYITPFVDVKRNKTLYVLYPTRNGGTLQRTVLYFNTIQHIISFICVIIFTLILVHNLRLQSQWRQKATMSHASLKSHSLSVRDKRVMKMVILLSGVYIFCFSPEAVNIFVMAFIPQYRVGGIYQDAYQISWEIISFLEVINNCVGIIIFYNMSSKYRTQLKQLFCKVKVRKSESDILVTGTHHYENV